MSGILLLSTCKKQVLCKTKSLGYYRRMPARTYGQYCGFARALEIVGERWALMIVRDLLVGPKRFGELQRGLPGIPSNILTARLKELEEEAIVERRLLDRAVVYALTDAGRELEESVITLGRWGAKRLGDPRPDEVVTDDSIAAALLTTFRPEGAGRRRVTFELRLGEVVVNARVRNGAVTVGRGPAENPDAVITAGPQLRLLLAREITPVQALKQKIVSVEGGKEYLEQFAQMFRI